MSIEQAVKFRDRINADADLGKRVLALKTSDGALNLTQLVVLAQDEGYSFDIAAARDTLNDLSGLEETELSDFELELVSAGSANFCEEPNCPSSGSSY